MTWYEIVLAGWVLNVVFFVAGYKLFHGNDPDRHMLIPAMMPVVIIPYALTVLGSIGLAIWIVKKVLTEYILWRSTWSGTPNRQTRRSKSKSPSRRR